MQIFYQQNINQREFHDTKYHRKIHKNYWKKKCKGKIKLLNSCLEELVVFNDKKGVYNLYKYNYQTIVTSIDINTSLGKKLKKSKISNQDLHKFVST